MAYPRPFFDLGQQSMFRIIRSARSRLGREHSVDDEKACARPSASRHSAAAELRPQLERPARRASTARLSLGGAPKQRLTRSRSSLEPSRGQGEGASENAPPEKCQQMPAALGSGVLSDVTNLAAPPAGQSPIVSGPKHHPASKAHAKPCPAQPQPAGGFCDAVVEADALHADDPQRVMEYMPDIYGLLQREETLCAAAPGYMDGQTQVNAKMRGILVDWLVSVQQKYKLKAETLFLAVGVIDRYLELKAVARKHLQLVGVTALLIAAKFEEVYPPQINDFIHVTDKAYSRDDIVKMETAILIALDFKICRPTPMQFFERYQVVNGCTDAHRDLAQYLLELTLVDYNMIKYSPSHLAASALFLSNKLLRRQPSWAPAAAKHTRLTEQVLKECAKELCGLLEHADHSPLQAVRKKYSQPKYNSVAKLTFTGTSAPAQPFSSDEARGARRSTASAHAPEELRAGRHSSGGYGQRSNAASAWEPPLAPRRSMGSPGAPTDLVMI